MTVAAERFLQFNQPDISDDEVTAVSNVLRSGWLGTGPETRMFEDEFCEFMMPKSHCVAVNSCTTGLILALKAKKIGQGDEVITTPLTFAATVNAILAVGAKPVFADVNELGLINPRQVAKSIGPKTKAIIPVHLHGAPCDMDSLVTIAKAHRLALIEDAAHAFGNKVGLGSRGDIGVFSFYPTKNITTGDGGMVVTKDEGTAGRIRILAAQGMSADAWFRYGKGPVKNYEVIYPGMKGLMNDIAAAMGRAQLRRWSEIEKRRAKVWDVYARAFGRKEFGHSHHIYSIRVKNRDIFRQQLNERGIGTGIHYNPLHLEPAYKFLGYNEGDFSVSEKIGRETLSLPLTSTMTVDDAVRVMNAVNEVRRVHD